MKCVFLLKVRLLCLKQVLLCLKHVLLYIKLQQEKNTEVTKVHTP